MARKITNRRVDRLVVFIYVLINAIFIRNAFVESDNYWYWSLLITLPLLLINKKITFKSNNHE